MDGFTADTVQRCVYKVYESVFRAAGFGSSISLAADSESFSPQCGFSSNAIGNKLTEDEQWAKIALVQEIAGEVWNS